VSYLLEDGALGPRDVVRLQGSGRRGVDPVNAMPRSCPASNHWQELPRLASSSAPPARAAATICQPLPPPARPPAEAAQPRGPHAKLSRQALTPSSRTRAACSATVATSRHPSLTHLSGLQKQPHAALRNDGRAARLPGIGPSAEQPGREPRWTHRQTAMVRLRRGLQAQARYCATRVPHERCDAVHHYITVSQGVMQYIITSLDHKV
jgi:hypothetical protein